LSTNAVFNVLCFFLLIIFGLSFLGFFEIRLPSSWANKLNVKSDTHGGILGMLFMALTLVVVSFSCTVPVLGYLLVEIAVQGDILAPAVGMLGFSIAIALPFTLFAVFPVILKKLPRSGMWMDHVKVTLGFLELAFSLKFLSVADMAYGWGILPRWLFLILWIIIFLMLALYHTGWLRFRDIGWARLSIAALSVALVIYLIPGLFGAPCHLVSAFAPPPSSSLPLSGDDVTIDDTEGVALPAHYTSYEEGMAAAEMTGKPVLLDFTGYGCVNCRKMESAVWGTPRVRKIINKDYLVIMLHVDDRTPLPSPQRITVNGKERILRSMGDMWSYLESYKFGNISQPFQVILTPDGKPLTSSYGYDEDIDKYVRYLKLGLAKYEQL
ncbi:MAG: thioredoxin family protein, partial [Prevotella sp.]|nr:thioredoxin family protein [Prevotella sp.]